MKYGVSRCGAGFRLAGLTVLLPMMAFAWWTSDGECPYGKQDYDLLTPHIPFAEKQAKPLKVLVTAYGPGQREVAELKERFDFEPVLFPTYRIQNVTPWEKGALELYAPGLGVETYEEEADKRLAQLDGCDAVVFGRNVPSQFPKEKLDRILARVRAGAGLLQIAPMDELVPIPGVELKEIDAASVFPVELVPSLKGTQLYEGVYGKGRVLEVVYPLPPPDIGKPARMYDQCVECLTPFDCDDPLYYDFCLAFVGKCLWCVTGTKPAGVVRTEKHAYAVTGEEVSAAQPPAHARLQVSKSYDAAGAVVDFAVEPLSGGQPAISGVTFPKDGYKPNERIVGEVRLADGCCGELTLTLTDEFGRELFRRTVVGAKGIMPVTIDLLHQKSRYAAFRTEYAEKGVLRDVAVRELFFDTSKDAVDDFTFTMWANANPKSRVLQLALEQMRANGVDVLLDTSLGYGTKRRYFENARRIQKTGLLRGVYTTRMVGPGRRGRNPQHAPTCHYFDQWPDLVSGKGKISEINPKTGLYSSVPMNFALAQKGLGMFFYSLGDENGLMAGSRDAKDENCFCGACQKRFREYLKTTYGTVAKLNQSVGGSYADWKDVRPLGFVEAVKARQYPLWVDFRTFMEDQFIAWHRYETTLIRAVDPEAVVGEEGMERPENSFMGFRFYDLLPHQGWSGPYYTERECHALKYLPPRSPKMAWYGAYVGFCSSAYMRRNPWRHLFSGLNGTAWWYACVVQNGLSFSYSGIFRPDLKPLKPFADSCEEIRFIRESGIGRMMCAAEPWRTGVAVHYSNPSLHASTLNPGRTTWDASQSEFNALLGECALQYEFLAPREIENGVPEDVRVFVLPYSQAMSDREVAAVRDFVARGGLLVADVLPADMDEHCSLRKDNPLADLFDARPLVPKRFGRGYAVLTGTTYADLEEKVAANAAAGAAAGFLRLCELAGVRPFARVTDAAGSLRRADVFRCGDLTLVGLLGPMPAQGKMKEGAGAEAGMQTSAAVGGSPERVIELPRKMWAYDLGRGSGGKCLGQDTRFTLMLESSCGRLVVFSEREIAAPRLERTDGGRAIAPGEVAAWRLSDVNGCACITVRNAKGHVVYTDRTRENEIRFSPAFNEGVGTFRMEVRSAVGGSVAADEFEVSKL